MRTLKTIAFSALLLLPIATAASAQSRDLWPYRTGDSWTYETDGPIDDGREFDVRVVQTSGGWCQVDGFLGRRWWWPSPGRDTIYSWDGSSGRAGLVFDLSRGPGSTFTSRIAGEPCVDRTLWKVVEDSASIETEVGRFEGCVVAVAVRPTCADDGLTRLAMAPGFGMVEYRWNTKAGEHRARIVGATVDGREYARPVGGVEVGITIDQAEYLLVVGGAPPPPGVSPFHPATIRVEIRITNRTAAPIDFHHASTQRYDFVVRDAAGLEVRRWSADQVFERSPMVQRLLPGRTLRFVESFELRDDGGTHLPRGEYTIEGIHWTAAAPLRSHATTSFRIRQQNMP